MAGCKPLVVVISGEMSAKHPMANMPERRVVTNVPTTDRKRIA